MSTDATRPWSSSLLPIFSPSLPSVSLFLFPPPVVGICVWQGRGWILADVSWPFILMALSPGRRLTFSFPEYSQDRVVMGPMWADFTLTLQGIYDGNPELSFCTYIDTDVKEDPSVVWYNLTNSIISNLILMATTFIRLLTKYPLYSLDV